MTRFIKTKPSLMEAGLPCSSLSAECQRNNNARQRPPQNRLHMVGTPPAHHLPRGNRLCAPSSRRPFTRSGATPTRFGAIGSRFGELDRSAGVAA